MKILLHPSLILFCCSKCQILHSVFHLTPWNDFISWRFVGFTLEEAVWSTWSLDNRSNLASDKRSNDKGVSSGQDEPGIFSVSHSVYHYHLNLRYFAEWNIWALARVNIALSPSHFHHPAAFNIGIYFRKIWEMQVTIVRHPPHRHPIPPHQTFTTPCAGLVWWMSYFTHGVVDIRCGECLM